MGANDGFLHAFQDHDSSVSEAWAFVMPEHLKTITLARDESPNDDRYYVDGSIAYKTVGREVILIVGARRGGNNYVALNVANFKNPLFKYEISPNSVGWDIGQSWGMPRFIDDGAYVLLPGGYDIAYDTDSPAKAKGAGVIGLAAASGAPNNRFKKLHGGIMQHSVLDLAAFDTNSDAVTDAIYYGDLGGHMFYATTIEVRADGEGAVGSEFTPYLLFKTNENSGRKFMFAPDMMVESGVQYIYFGSGDRESPMSRNVQDRFYCVKNDGKTHLDTSARGAAYLTDSKVYDATANDAQSKDENIKVKAKSDMDDADGWFFDLGRGEKVVGSPVVFKDHVVFTTYQPDEDAVEADPTDPCKSGGTSGKARMYMVNYRYATGSMGVESNERSEVIGNTIPSAPVLSIFQVDDNTINVKVTITVGLKDENGNQSIGVIQRDLGSFDQSAPVGGLEVFYWREFY